MKIFFLLFFFCCSSFATPVPPEDLTDAELYDRAVSALETRDFWPSLQFLDRLSKEFSSQTFVVRTRVGVYVGLCSGSLAIEIVDFLGGQGSPLPNFLAFSSSKSVHSQFCQKAQDLVEKTWDPRPEFRPEHINLSMAMIGVAKLGSLLSERVDQDRDGRVDPIFLSACSDLSAAEIQFAGSGLGLIFNNWVAFEGLFKGTESHRVFQQLMPECGPACRITDSSSANWNVQTRNVISAVIQSSQYGIMDCGMGLACCP